MTLPVWKHITLHHADYAVSTDNPLELVVSNDPAWFYADADLMAVILQRPHATRPVVTASMDRAAVRSLRDWCNDILEGRYAHPQTGETAGIDVDLAHPHRKETT